MHANFSNKGQLLEIENDNIEEEKYAEQVELEGMDIVTLEKKSRL